MQDLIVCVFAYVAIVAIAYCPSRRIEQSVVTEQPVDYFPEFDDDEPTEYGVEEITIDWWLTMTKKELMSIARNRGLKGYSKIKKLDLAIALHSLPLLDPVY